MGSFRVVLHPRLQQDVCPIAAAGKIKRNAGGEEGHKAAENSLTADLKHFIFLLAGRVGWRGVERFAWLGLALLVVEKKWGCSRKSGNQTTGTPNRSRPRLWGEARQFVPGFFFSNDYPPFPHISQFVLPGDPTPYVAYEVHNYLTIECSSMIPTPRANRYAAVAS